MEKTTTETNIATHEKVSAWDEKRIRKLEDGLMKLGTDVIKVNENIKTFTIQNEERSKLMFTQNENLMKQNQSLLDTTQSIFSLVTINKENESIRQDQKVENDRVRKHEIRKIALETFAKIALSLIGAGGIIYLIIDAILKI